MTGAFNAEIGVTTSFHEGHALINRHVVFFAIRRGENDRWHDAQHSISSLCGFAVAWHLLTLDPLLQRNQHFRKLFEIGFTAVPAAGNADGAAGMRASLHRLQHMAFMNFAG